MKKKLVEAHSLDAYICQACGKFYADGSVILTPGAKDALSKRGISLEYGPACACLGRASTACAEPANASGVEKLLFAVASILQNQYGITDPEQLKAISCHVVQTIKDNI